MQRHHIEFAIIEHFKASTNHILELFEYAAIAYIECINDMIRLMTNKGIEVVILVLTEAKKLYGPPASPSQTTRVEPPKASLIVNDDQEVTLVVLIPFLTLTPWTIFLRKTLLIVWVLGSVFLQPFL